MKKISVLLLALCLLVITSSCADSKDNIADTTAEQKTISTTSSSSEDGDGYKSSMAKACGFEMGKVKLTEIINEYGENYSDYRNYTEESTGDKLISVSYDNGLSFIFSLEYADKADNSVLISVTVSDSSDKEGPGSIKLGMDKYEAAELIYSGAKEKMIAAEKSESKEDYHIIYGNAATYDGEKAVFPPFCKYYTKTEYTNYSSTLVFAVIHDGFTGNVEDLGSDIIYTRLNRLTMNFDKDDKLVNYSISYTAEAE